MIATFSSRLAPLPLVVLFAALHLAAQNTAPTATLAPEALDQQWASAVASYSVPRQQELDQLARTVAAGPFRDDWPSLKQHTTPAWFQDAKFGIFIHWGVFSVPAFGSEWYSRNMYQQGTPEFAHHRAVYGPQTQFGYKDFIPQFRMEHFDPAAWAELFRRAGARYVVPVAEHHDGFALYTTKLSRWNAVAMGPHRDLVGDLATAVRAKGLRMGLSYHRAEHDWFFEGGRSFPSDVNDPRFADFYGPAQIRDLESSDDALLSKDYTFVSTGFRDDWLARSVELVEHYHPDLVYFDWWVGDPDFRATEERFATFLYNHAAQNHRDVVMFTKNANMPIGAGTLDVERGALTGIQAQPWQTDTSLSNASWGYVERDTYKSPQVILDQLIDVVSKNGNLLLNIGPRADGTIPQPVQDTLLAVGRWLEVNGEAIYGTRPWTQFGEGPHNVRSGPFGDSTEPTYTPQDIRFTAHGRLLYAILMRAPTGGQALIHSLATGKGGVRNVSLLGSQERVIWQQSADGLHVTLPQAHTAELNPVLRIELQ